MHTLLADAFFGQTFFQIFAFMAVAFLWAFSLIELLRSGSHGWVKAVWALVIICLPVVGSLVYLLTAPTKALDFDPYDKPMTEHQRTQMDYQMTRRPIG